MRTRKHNEDGFTQVELLVVLLILGVLAIPVLIAFIGGAEKRQKYDMEDYGHEYYMHVNFFYDESWEPEDGYPEVYTNWKDTPDTPNSEAYWTRETISNDGDRLTKKRSEIDDISLHAYDMADAEHEEIDFEPGQAYCIVSTRDNKENTEVYYLGIDDYFGEVIDVPCEEYSIDEGILPKSN